MTQTIRRVVIEAGREIPRVLDYQFRCSVQYGTAREYEVAFHIVHSADTVWQRPIARAADTAEAEIQRVIGGGRMSGGPATSMGRNVFNPPTIEERR